jgi:glycerol-3-phosphate cytidylyltransferase
MSETIVYTCGVYDLFHVGHLNLLRAARALGDRLIVGVSTDELVESYKPGSLVVPFQERIEVVRAIRYVDACVPQHDRDKFEAWQRLKYDVWVVGDDWYGAEKYDTWRKQLEAVGVRCVFLPYTRNQSSTRLRDQIAEVIG